MNLFARFVSERISMLTGLSVCAVLTLAKPCRVLRALNATEAKTAMQNPVSVWKC